MSRLRVISWLLILVAAFYIIKALSGSVGELGDSIDSAIEGVGDSIKDASFIIDDTNDAIDEAAEDLGDSARDMFDK